MENFEAFKGHLEANLKDAKTNLALWKNVKRLSKKNGEDFQNFGKNFDGATIDHDAIFEDRLSVHGRIEHGIAWAEDHIDLVREATSDIEADRRYKPYTFSNVEKYHLTVSETFEKIEDRIKYYEVQVYNYELQLMHARSIYDLTVNTVNAMYAEAMKELEEAGYKPTYTIDTPSLLYQMHNLLEHAFPPHMNVKKEEVEAMYRT